MDGRRETTLSLNLPGLLHAGTAAPREEEHENSALLNSTLLPQEELEELFGAIDRAKGQATGFIDKVGGPGNGVRCAGGTAQHV